VLHTLVKEHGGAMARDTFFGEAEKRTGAEHKAIYSALRSSQVLRFGRHGVAVASSHKELMEKLGFKEVVDDVIEGPGMMTTLYVHYEKV